VGDGGGRRSAWSRGARRLQFGAALAAVGLTLALAQQPVRGAFNGSANTTASQASTAATFCTTPGSSTVTATADSWANQSNVSSTAGGTEYYVYVNSQTGAARRAFVKFDLPSFSSRCSVTSATLRLYTDSGASNRLLHVYRATAGWTEAALNWSNQPGTGSSVATATVNAQNVYISWNVTTLVREIYAATDYGFVVRDPVETQSGWNQFIARQGTSPPKLDVTWG
jgi:hypothetical protein